MNIRPLLVNQHLNSVLCGTLENRHSRKLLLKLVKRQLSRESETYRPDDMPVQAKIDRLDCLSGLLDGFDRIFLRGIVSKSVMKQVVHSFLGNVVLNEDVREIERRHGGVSPPAFIVISPTGKCNLRCKGCYAADAALQGRQLSFEVFDRILREKREMWGSHWTVISGGEPFMWKDGEWDLVKLARRHPMDIFMVYTNGTLIDDEFAARLAEAGNISPAISVEGFETETDARRGEGVYQRILKAFDALRRHGVPFGVSATATRHNWATITSDEFIDFYYMDQGALYGWIFQYMPMGRGQTLDLIVPPEERVEMSRRMWHLVRERKILMVDFWNSGTVTQGCISAAREGGYFHINWDGDIMPCVFTPYAGGNINTLYAEGGNLDDVIDLPFFRRIREWQEEYGYGKPAKDTGNWLCPCAIRDHFDVFSEVAKASGAVPINPEAGQAITDSGYHQGMIDYGRRMAELTDMDWAGKYTRVYKKQAANDAEGGSSDDTALTRSNY
ncbi:MAG: radical SAM protein [Armatimonadota bacterium]